MRRLRDIESGRTRRRIGRRVSGTRYVFGNRTRVDSNCIITERLYSIGALSSVAAEYNESGEVTRRNLLLGGVVVGETTAAGSRYFHGDVLGSVRLVTDAGGAVVASADYGAYGAVRRTSGSMPAYGYVGMYGVERDAATGLLFMRARYYSPMIGRFISRDPIGLSSGDVNWYRYCGNALLLAADPCGLDWRSILCEWLNNYDRSLKGLNDEWAKPFGLDVSDSLGYWGLSSAAIGVTTDLLVSAVDAAAEDQIARGQLAGALCEGNIFQKQAAANRGAQMAARTATGRACLQAVSKASGVIGAAATGWSFGVRAGFRINAAISATLEMFR